MSNLGGPLAFALGGGPGAAENAYQALRSAVGVGGSRTDGPEGSIVEAWRWAKARGLAATLLDDERAVLQCSPLVATDFLPVFEQLLRQQFPAGTPDATKQAVLAELYVALSNAAGPTLIEQLQAFAPTCSINYPDRDFLIEAQPGRFHEDWDPSSPHASGPAFGYSGGRKESAVPNYSDDFRTIVHLPLAPGVMTSEGAAQIARIHDLLGDELPCWIAFNVWCASGFVLDQDLLDVTVFADLLFEGDVLTLDGTPITLDGDPVVL